MYRILSICLLLLCAATGINAQPQPEPYGYDLDYFMPDGNYKYNSAIPTPEQVLGFQIGQQHADWGNVVTYMNALAAASPRVTVRETGRTYQHRPFIEVVITSEQNQKDIETIKNRHLELTEVDKSGKLTTDNMPVVVSIVASIHGN